MNCSFPSPQKLIYLKTFSALSTFASFHSQDILKCKSPLCWTCKWHFISLNIKSDILTWLESPTWLSLTYLCQPQLYYVHLLHSLQPFWPVAPQQLAIHIFFLGQHSFILHLSKHPGLWSQRSFTSS